MIVVADSSPLHYLLLDLRITGTLGVLRSAAEKGLIDVAAVLERLRATNFYVDDDLLEREFGRWTKQ